LADKKLPTAYSIREKLSRDVSLALIAMPRCEVWIHAGEIFDRFENNFAPQQYLWRAWVYIFCALMWL